MEMVQCTCSTLVHCETIQITAEQVNRNLTVTAVTVAINPLESNVRGM